MEIRRDQYIDSDRSDETALAVAPFNPARRVAETSPNLDDE